MTIVVIFPEFVLPRVNERMSPEKGPLFVGNFIEPNHQFSVDMLVFRGLQDGPVPVFVNGVIAIITPIHGLING